MTDKVEQESLMVPVSSTVQLHLRRIWSGTQGTAPPLLLLLRLLLLMRPLLMRLITLSSPPWSS
jgi:hypothetical protein